MSQGPKSERKGEPISGDRRHKKDKNKDTHSKGDSKTNGNRGMPQHDQGDEDGSMDEDQTRKQGKRAQNPGSEDYTG